MSPSNCQLGLQSLKTWPGSKSNFQSHSHGSWQETSGPLHGAVQYRASLVTQDREHGRNICQWLLWFSLRTTLHHLHQSLYLRIKSLTYVLSHSVMSSSCESIDCSLPGSSLHGILQARMPEWVAISFSRGSSWPRDWTQVSCIAGRLFTDWAMREAQSSHHVQLTQGEGKLHLLKGRVFKTVWTTKVGK